jgi:hypothetical protein
MRLITGCSHRESDLALRVEFQRLERRRGDKYVGVRHPAGVVSADSLAEEFAMRQLDDAQHVVRLIPVAPGWHQPDERQQQR